MKNFPIGIVIFFSVLFGMFLLGVFVIPGEFDPINKQHIWNGVYPGMRVKILQGFVKLHPLKTLSHEGKNVARAMKDYKIYVMNVCISNYQFDALVLNNQIIGFEMFNPPKSIIKSLYRHCLKYMKDDRSGGYGTQLYTATVSIDAASQFYLDTEMGIIQWTLVGKYLEFCKRRASLSAKVAMEEKLK